MRKKWALFFTTLLPVKQQPRMAENSFALRKKAGFTLIELIVSMVIMGVLAAAGTVVYNQMVVHFSQASCKDSRQQAVQAFVSDYLQGEISRNLSSFTGTDGSERCKQWLRDYRSRSQTNGDEWTLTVEKVQGTETSYRVRIACARHTDEAPDQQPSAVVNEVDLKTSGTTGGT